MVFFFFKQKTAYEMLRSLVGSEMCIRDSRRPCVESQSIIMTAVRGNGDGGVGRTATEHTQDLSLIHI